MIKKIHILAIISILAVFSLTGCENMPGTEKEDPMTITDNSIEAAIEKEFERLLPTMRSGGYIPSVDHQTPPYVSLKNYRHYLRLLEKYCHLAVQ
jgi:hypothetical protein